MPLQSQSRMDAELRSMVMAFRVTELQTLLGYAGKNKTGRKNELQARSLELVKTKSHPIVMKIKELYRSIQLSTLGQPLSAVGSGSSSTFGGSASGLAASRLFGSGYTSTEAAKLDTTYGRGFGVGSNRTITVDGQYRTVPICPDVTMKKLPFYDIHSVLLRPTSLLSQGQLPKQEAQHSFCLTPSQASEISSSREIIVNQSEPNPIPKIQYIVQVQIRFCAIESSVEEQEDLFPPGLIVKVNGRLIQLPHPIPSNRPGVEPKRPSRPLNVTNNVKCCPHNTNTIHVSWMADNTKSYAMSVYIVKKLTAEELLQRLKSKRIQPADFTRGRIKEITTAEEEDLCAPTSIRVSVACPLGKNRMTWPCRATTCKHLQCFDANAFILMNEKKPTFICPVCNKHLKFDDLSIDGYFMDVIQNLSIDAGNDIELFADGTWLPAIRIKNEVETIGPPAKRLKPMEPKPANLNDTVDLDDDICIVEEDAPTASTSQSSNKAGSQKAQPEVIDLIDSSDEEEDTRQSSGGSTMVCQEESKNETEKANPNAAAVDDDETDDEDSIGIRPRRRKARVNYVEDSSSDSSSTNEGSAPAVALRSPQRERSPACIELSDSSTPSPEPRRAPPPATVEQQRRAFAAVAAANLASSSPTPSSSSRSSPHVAQNPRSGSGSSTTLYSSSAATTMPTNPGIGMGGLLHSYSATTPTYFTQSTFTTSVSSSSSAIASPSASSLLYPSASSATSGYTAYDAARSSWEAEMNSYINPASFSQVDLGYDYLNAASQHGYDPRAAGGGGGPYNGRWM